MIALHKISKYYANRNLIAVGVLLMLSGNAGIILGMGSANERRRYIVTSSLTVWTHTQDNPWGCVHRNCWYCWVINHSWRRHVMKTLSAFLVRNSPVTAGFPSQKPSNALFSCFLVNVIKLQSCRLCNITLMDFRCDPVYLFIYLFIIYFVFIYFKMKNILARDNLPRCWSLHLRIPNNPPCRIWLMERKRIWWRHDMETLSAILALCEENPPLAGGSPRKGSVIWIFGVSFVISLSKLLNKW